MASSTEYVKIPLDYDRILRYKHKDLRDAVTDSGKSIGALYTDAFGGWPYLLKYGLRAQDPKITLDQCSGFIDLWVETHESENAPLELLGDLLLEALQRSKFVKFQPEIGKTPEGNASPEASSTLGGQ